MKLNQIADNKGAHKARKRIGRGIGSGTGKTSGKGHKGQKSRAGVSFQPYFEGGQFPSIRRLPKFGFNNKNFKTDYEVVNVSALEKAFSAGDTGGGLSASEAARDASILSWAARVQASSKI